MSIACLSGRVVLDETLLIDEIDLSIDEGWMCLLGASGSGKSTLLRLLAGLSCQARLEGRKEVPDKIGWMAQSDLLQPRFSAVNNVKLMHRLRGSDISDKQAKSLLENVGLSDKIDAMPHELSGGQRQRVALARVLADGAPLVLLDEPFSALDPITRVAMQDITYQCLKGCAVVMVSHDPSEALRLSDNVLILKDKKLVQEQAIAGDKPLPIGDPSLNVASGDLLNRLASNIKS